MVSAKGVVKGHESCKAVRGYVSGVGEREELVG